MALGMSRGLGLALRDTVLTRDEVKGLTASLLVSDDPPLGTASLREWVREHADTMGSTYASETARHYRWTADVDRNPHSTHRARPSALAPRSSTRGGRTCAPCSARMGGRRTYAQPTGPRDEPLPAAARKQPRRLVRVGTGGPGAGRPRGPAHLPEHRLLLMPLVPRHGTGVLRGPGDRGADEPPLCLHQGGPRGAPRP